MASAGGAALALLVLLPVAAASDSDHKVGYPAGASHPHASRSVTSERARARARHARRQTSFLLPCSPCRGGGLGPRARLRPPLDPRSPGGQICVAPPRAGGISGWHARGIEPSRGRWILPLPVSEYGLGVKMSAALC